MYRRTAIKCSAATAISASIKAKTIAATEPVATGPIVIGRSVAPSGPVSNQVKAINAKAQLAFDKTSRSGGVHGRTLQIIAIGDGLQPDKKVANCELLLTERRAVVIFGFAGSANLIAAEPALECIIDTLSRLENEVPVEANASFMSPREAGMVSLADIGVKRSG